MITDISQTSVRVQEIHRLVLNAGFTFMGFDQVTPTRVRLLYSRHDDGCKCGTVVSNDGVLLDTTADFEGGVSI